MLTLVCFVVSEGRPFSVEIDAEKIVDVLKKKIKEENKNTIACDAKELELHCVDGLKQITKTRFDFNGAVIDDMPAKLLSDFDGSTSEMVETFPLSSYPQLNDSSVGRIHVLVVVPEGAVSALTSICKPTHPKRKARWDQLNAILDENKKKSKLHDSTAYSYVTWSDVKEIFRTTPYIQPHKALPELQLDFLAHYLSVAMKCFKPVTEGNESQRLHVIAPILICVCFLFDGDVVIDVEEDLNGEYVKAHGHFEFVLRRGKKKVCIVEAKKDDLLQGMAQDLLGCEVEVDLHGHDIVYGIVTNYVQWNFLRSLTDKIEMEECSLRLGPTGPDLASLGEIAGKIYSMLSDE